MKTGRNLILLFSGIWLIGYGAYNLFFRPVQKVEIVKVIEYDTITDTLYLPKPIPFFRDTGTYKIVRLPADTIAILAAINRLNTLNVYKRQLVSDSLLQVTITDSVQFNELQGGRVEYQYQQKTIKETVIQEVNKKDKYSLYIGIAAGYSDRTILLPSVGLQKAGHQLFFSGNDKMLLVSYNYQIFKR